MVKNCGNLRILKFPTSRKEIFSNSYSIIIVTLFSIHVFFISLTINSFSKIFKHREYTKLIGLVFFCMWFPKLFFSIYIFEDIGIWCFLAFGFLNFEKNRQLNKSLDDYDLLEENNMRIDKKFVLTK